MDDLDDNISSTKFESLFIKEEESDGTLMEQTECTTTQPGLVFTGTPLNQSAMMKPYLQEMDDLLKSCEELTGVPFTSHFTESYNENSLTASTHSRSKEEDGKERYGGRSVSPQAYYSTSYIDTHMERTTAGEQQAQGWSQDINKCGVTTDVFQQRELPLTLAGNKLSDSMVEYEGRLLGMLAMLESCMEETGMDFEPPEWTADASQEYVHISKDQHLCKGTTLVPIRLERPVKVETQPMQLESVDGMHVEEGEVSKQSRSEMVEGSATNVSQQSPILQCDDRGNFSLERMKNHGILKTDAWAQDPQTESPDGMENDPMCCEATKMGCISTNGATSMKGDVTWIEVDDSEEGQVLKMETSDERSVMNDLNTVGTQMEACIEEVQHLEKRRKELLAEVLKLRGSKDGPEAEEGEKPIDGIVAELMVALRKEEEGRREERKKEIQSLREERAEEEKRMWKVNLERQGLQEELRKLKRRLFTVAKDCAHSQVALNTQQREMELLRREEEKLKSLVLQLTEESSHLKATHQQQLAEMQAELQARSSSRTSSTQEDLSQCRRHSCGDIQQYLQSGLKVLEDRYEPVLLALLKRREVTAGALVKAKEQAQEQRAQLRPLKEEIQKLKLQKACLEEKLNLVHIQRKEDVGQYKETVYCLEESSRELKNELKIQKRKTKEMEELRDSLTQQLLLYRAAVKDHEVDKEKT